MKNKLKIMSVVGAREPEPPARFMAASLMEWLRFVENQVLEGCVS